ncbi:MAG: NAD(P)/FAD-dependent oxidoreductase [Vulcanimicrobiaceae bacterium]
MVLEQGMVWRRGKALVMEIVDVAVIGAGLCGAAIAHELVSSGYQTVVFEAKSEPAAGASRSNSGVLHTGFDSTPETLETRMIRAQAQRWPALFDTLQIPYQRSGALLLAKNVADVERFPKIVADADRNGVRVRALNRTELRKVEPYAEAVAAIHVPDEAITDPFEVVQRLLASVRVHFDAPVRAVEPTSSGATLQFASTLVLARTVINCAGLFGDEIAADQTFSIIARRGEFAVYAALDSSPLQHILLPMPTARTKGVLVFPTLYGNICAGPSAVDQDDKDDWRPRIDELREIRAQAVSMFPPIQAMQMVDAWAGLRPSGVPQSYVIDWSPRVPAMMNVGAIRSTGLSACLGIAQYVRGQLRERDIAPRAPRFAVPQAHFEAPKPWWQRVNELHGIAGPC